MTRTRAIALGAFAALALTLAAALLALWPRPETGSSARVPGGAAPAVAQAARPTLDAPPPPALQVLEAVRSADTAMTDRALWDARRRLTETPAMAEDLADVALAEGTADGGRALALDLLAHEGSPTAQAALVRALTSPLLRARAGQQTGLLVQRIGFVDRPTPALMAAAQALARDDDPEVRRAALAAAGGVARRAGTAGERAAADALLDATLRGDAFGDPADEAARLLGLGNAGRPEDRGTLLAAAVDRRAPIRHAAVRGLRPYSDPAVLAQLAAAAADADRAIQRAGLRGLAGRATLPDGVVDQLARAVRTEALHRTNDALLVTVLAAHAARPAARSALQAVLDRAGDDAALRARIRGVLRAGG